MPMACWGPRLMIFRYGARRTRSSCFTTSWSGAKSDREQPSCRSVKENCCWRDDLMETTPMSSGSIFLIVAAIVVIVAIVVATFIYYRQQAERRHRFRGRFGPEYDRLVAVLGSARAAERELEQRE